MVLLAAGFCGIYVYVNNSKVPTETPSQTPTQTGINNSSPSDEITDDSELIIKTENRVSDEEADEMLNEVDRQLDNLIEALDGLDAVDTTELPDEEGV